MRRQIQASYVRLVAYADPDPVTVPESVYVRRFVDNYVAAYQMRAGEALRQIGSDAARRVLREAFTLSQTRAYREDVLRALAIAVDLRLAIQAGNGQVAPINTFVPIVPAVLVRDSVGIPLQNVTVSFAVDSGGGSVVDSVRTTNALGIAIVGGWRLGPTPGTNVLRVTAAGRTTRFTATAVQ
jgi:hypothetical protein